MSLNQEAAIYGTPRLVSAFEIAKYKVSKYRSCCILKPLLKDTLFVSLLYLEYAK